MELVFSSGRMEHNIMANGVIIKCTEKANSDGPTAESTMESTSMIRSMVREFTHGQMGVCIRVNSSMVNSMAKVFIDKIMVRKFTAFGKKERR